MKTRGGFTLIELLSVLLIVGILTAYAVPRYLRTLEVSKADDAVALINMVGTTNKMFALDHGGVYAIGQLSASCGPGPVPPAPCVVNPPYAACALVWCRYLADQDFAIKTYDIFACDGKISQACATLGSDKFVAGAKRKAPPASAAPYDTWGVTMNVGGQITAYGTTQPIPTY